MLQQTELAPGRHGMLISYAGQAGPAPNSETLSGALPHEERGPTGGHARTQHDALTIDT